MTGRFEQEFYKSPWHRVLPVGPGGIQPYVRPARERAARAAALPWRRLAAIVGPIFGRWAAISVAKRPMIEDVAPRRQRSAPRIASKAAAAQVSLDPGTLRLLRKAA